MENNVDILTYNINEFIENINKFNKSSELLLKNIE